jgi:hypothetical protein
MGVASTYIESIPKVTMTAATKRLIKDFISSPSDEVNVRDTTDGSGLPLPSSKRSTVQRDLCLTVPSVFSTFKKIQQQPAADPKNASNSKTCTAYITPILHILPLYCSLM